MNYLATFTHPAHWKDIFLQIIEKLGPKFYEWDGGIGFGDNLTEIIIEHRDGQRKAHFGCVDICISPPCVAGTWFTTLYEQKKKVPGITLRNRREKSRVRVRFDKKEFETVLSFGKDTNALPIGDKVYLEPIGWCATDAVELIEIIPWLKETKDASKPPE